MAGIIEGVWHGGITEGEFHASGAFIRYITVTYRTFTEGRRDGYAPSHPI